MPDTGLVGLDLRLRRRSVYGYTIGLAAYALVIVAIYPSFRSDASLDQLLTNDPTMAALFGVSGSLTSPTGWLNANLYANFVPLVILLITIGYGASCLAGQDEDGTLGLIATLPVSRRKIVLQKAVALIALALPAALATMACVLVGRGFDLDVDAGALVGITVGVLLLGVDFGALAMLIGAASGSRGTALGVTSALAAAAYLISSLAPVVHWLAPARFASPFFYAVGDGQLDHGLPLPWFGVLAGIAVAAVTASIAAFERLDLH